VNGIHLRIYTTENRKHGGTLVYEWLLAEARKLGAHGGSAFIALAGFGRHGRMHEQHFFELAGEVPVLVEFVLEEALAMRLLERLAEEGLELFYTWSAIEHGTAGRGA